MFNIRKLLKFSTKHLIQIGSESIDPDCFFKVDNFTYLVFPAVCPIMPNFADLIGDFFIKGIFELADCYSESGMPFLLLQLSMNRVDSINCSVFWRSCKSDEDYSEETKVKEKSDRYFELPANYNQNYKEYLLSIEELINNDIFTEKRCIEYEFNQIPIDTLDKMLMFPRYYTKDSMRFREMLKNEDTVRLSDVADIVSPQNGLKTSEKIINSGDEKLVLFWNDCHYPFDPSKITRKKTQSTLILHKGDIVDYLGEFFLINSEPLEPVYYERDVIRPKSILPEYLYLYLNSDTYRRLKDSVSVSTSFGISTPYSRENALIVMPKYSKEYYLDEFEQIANPNIRHYSNLDKGKSDNKPKETIEDILDSEIANNLRVKYVDQLRSFLSDDLKELNTCFRNECWKSCLILAGSILEAVLIDWLSEIDHKNYFEEDYIVEKDGYETKGDLIDYINAIDRIKRPNWMREASVAHEIRKKRNLVHAKLCMKEDVDISRDTCEKVIGYLKMVLKTRDIEIK